MNSYRRLAGQTALVTGGGSGIGEASAVALAREGASVIVGDISKDTADDTVATIRGDGGLAWFVPLDVANPESCAAFTAAAQTLTGRIDVLFHAAGVQFQDTLAVDTSDEEWERFIAVNLSGTFYICRATIPYMIQQESGAIILMASGRVFMGTARSTAYAASKGGVASFGFSLAWELGPHNISVNSIAPGITNTAGTREYQREVLGKTPEEVIATFAQSDPLGKVSTPADVATAVVYLAGEGRWITGQLHQLRVYAS